MNALENFDKNSIGVSFDLNICIYASNINMCN